MNKGMLASLDVQPIRDRLKTEVMEAKTTDFLEITRFLLRSMFFISFEENLREGSGQMSVGGH